MMVNYMIKTLENTLHMPVVVESKTGRFGLPFYLTSGCDFFDAKVGGIGFSIVSVKQTGSTDIRKIKHQLGMYEDAFSGQVCFWIPDLTRIKRDALVKAGIPFVAPPGQVYLPFLGISLQDRFPKVSQAPASLMSPLEQELFFFLIYNTGEYNKAQLAGRLFVTRAAITKITSALANKGLIRERKVGKEVFVSLASDGRSSYENAKKWLIDPVKKRVYCRNSHVARTLVLAGESALGNMSMLSHPDKEVRACYERDERVSELDIIDDDSWIDDADYIVLELWKYDPDTLSRHMMVDVLSLALSLAGTNDERVRGEMEEVMEAHEWQ